MPGAYVNGRYVAKGKGGGKGGDKPKKEWNDDQAYERKAGDEDTVLERKFDIDILQPGEARVGYLFNVKTTRHYDEGGRTLAGLLLYFLQRDGRTFRCTFLYRPYMFVSLGMNATPSALETMRDILSGRFEGDDCHVSIVAKEDLDMEDHIVGRQRKVLKLSFGSEENHKRARQDLLKELRKQQRNDGFTFGGDEKKKSAMEGIEGLNEYDIDYVNRVLIDNKINSGRWFDVSRNQMITSVENIWDTQCVVKCKEEMLYKPGLRIFAWDIETTKEPLKFPDSAHDRITMISAMVDGTGFLIVNRTEVSADIEPLEYTPKPEYEGFFDTFNEPDEASLLRRFFTLIRETNPHVMATYNGDFFDCPFITQRAKVYNLSWAEECGIEKKEDAEIYCGKWLVHLDCFNWVQRDSFLPCGARGLKAVTRYKLKYDPVELDPEDMTPFAKERPQELAAYSVSDAVATYYLYMKYIHDFIFALCTIIPYSPDDVLRKGSGTLCESLLMNQAFIANVIFPNKHQDVAIDFHEGTNRMIEQSTYEGARVECMRVGVFRADIAETFQLEVGAFQVLLNDLKPTIDFFLEVEESLKLEDVENYQEILTECEKQLRGLCDPDKVAEQLGRMNQSSPTKKNLERDDDYTLKLVEYAIGSGGVKGGTKVMKSSYRVIREDLPLIYHLDVGAMYPNIILSNRLQPSAIVTKEFCNACSYNDPVNNCKREMGWKWRGDLYMATRADVKSIMNEMENDKRRYNKKDRDSGEIVRVKWKELGTNEQTAEIIKSVREFSVKAYRRLKSSVYEDKKDTVCQRENSFYVDTVRMFRDRRYTFKRLTKEWGQNLEKAQETGDVVKIGEAKDMCLLYDSLQLAHKCILNSFYGYVMRKGARWHSMKMAGIVTYTGSNLIREAREFCDMVGLPIELDTDGIWCMLPKGFPDVYKFKMKNGKVIKMPYPNCVLNYRVHQKYTNHQYQARDEKGNWKVQSENSIFFEIDGPYRCMVLPASTEEDKFLKKRYAVFNTDGSIAELKGFEVKRRGELRLIQVFQTEVFPAFLKGTTKAEVYQVIGEMANRWLDVIDSKGKTMSDEEVIYFFSEQKSMSKSVQDSGTQKSVQITCARRLAEFLGTDTYITSPSVSCHMFISGKPHNASVTERSIPVKIFGSELPIKSEFLKKWLKDPSLSNFDMRTIIDWAYYRDRLCAVFLKLICITSAYQNVPNPCPRVKVPDWLHKRLAEKNDKFQQRSLGMFFQKAGAGGAKDASKRTIGDMEDLAGPKPGSAKALPELPAVQFGAGPRRWLESQRVRWANEQAAGTSQLVQSTAWRSSLFDDGAAWTAMAMEALLSTWHVVALEPAHHVRNYSSLRPGDAVIATVSGDGDDMLDGEAEGEPVRGTVSGFVGGLIRVVLETGEERLLRQSAVKPAKEEGLFVLWLATGQNLQLHRCEVLARRRVVLALEKEFSPEAARRDVLPRDLKKNMRVWPKSPDVQREGPGVVTGAAPAIGVCSVTWSSGCAEAILCSELEQQCGSVTEVLKEPPRNIQHACLVELELGEDEFQQQRGEGALGDGDAAWPRVESVYEAEQPLDFDLICRLGPMAKLKVQERAEEAQSRGTCRFNADDLQTVPHAEYLHGLGPTRNVYMLLCFDRARPSWAFCGIFSPVLAEAWVCYAGIGAAEGEDMRAELERTLSELLAQAGSGGKQSLNLVRAEVTFLSGKSTVGAVLQWAEQRLQDVRRRDGGSVCVLCSQLATGELRGVAPSFWVDQRQLRHLTALRELPICRAPFIKDDAHFPALDWPRWITKRFASRMPSLYTWWQKRLSLCRVAGLPVCNAPEIPTAVVPVALDTLYSRQLQKDGQLRWASPTCRPDLGETSLAIIDAQEDSVSGMDWILQGKDLTAGRGGGQINNPGVYHSICMEVNLKTKLCICALQHARHLSDMEGGELSRKMIQKNAEGAVVRNPDHTSEVSLASFESLVTMVQDIATACETKERELVDVRTKWAQQSEAATAMVKEYGLRLEVVTPNDDAQFLEAMAKSGHDDASLAAKLESLRLEHEAHMRLLDGLYGWLASETSLLHDAALLRKTHSYMDKVLQLFTGRLKQNGCSVIHASYTKVVFATGKLKVLPDIQIFWDSLCSNMQSVKALEPLALSDASCLAELYYGMIWMDPANWSVVPIDISTGDIQWKARSNWKLADFLPVAVRTSLILYASELLIGPQRELGRRSGAEAADQPAEAMEVEEAQAGEGAAEAVAKSGGAGANPMDCDEPGDDDFDFDAAADEQGGGACEGPPDEGPPDEQMEQGAPPEEGAAADGEAAAEGAAAAPSSDAAAQNAKLFDELREFVQNKFFTGLRRRILQCLREIQAQQQREAPKDSTDFNSDPAYLASIAAQHDSASESSGDEGCTAQDPGLAEERRAERVRRYLEQKWSFPPVPGRKKAPGSVEIEFLRALTQVLNLEEWLQDQVLMLRERMCQVLNVSSFGQAALDFESPCFPLVLRDVPCPWCRTASHVDVTSHLYRGPGLWVCSSCEKLYDKDTMQAMLVSLLESTVQAWHSQDIKCRKCKALRTSSVQLICQCFGRYENRFKETDFRLVFSVMRSLTEPHDLPWLSEMLTFYEHMLPPPAAAVANGAF